MTTTKSYALIEGHSVHTPDLTLEEANEMLERHSRIFNTINWAVVPMAETKGMDRLKGYLETQKNINVKYSKV